MTNPMFDRTKRVLGEDAVEYLRSVRVAVVGLGGVGGYAVEALARTPVGALVLVDPDVVAATNLNRQLAALQSTIGRPKTEVLAERVRDIRPDLTVSIHTTAFCQADAATLFTPPPDGVVDAIDDVEAKIALIRWCSEHRVPIVSSMGAGFRTDPARVRAADISETRGCPLARTVRRRLRALGISTGVRAVFSDEPPVSAERADGVVGAVSWCPGVFGLTCAGELIRLLLASGGYDVNIGRSRSNVEP